VVWEDGGGNLASYPILAGVFRDSTLKRQIQQ
jgi:hypothetical protein